MEEFAIRKGLMYERPLDPSLGLVLVVTLSYDKFTTE